MSIPISRFDLRKPTTIYQSFFWSLKPVGQKAREEIESQYLKFASMPSFPNYYVCDLRNYPMKRALYFRILSEWVGCGPEPVPRVKSPRARLGSGPWRAPPKPRFFFVASLLLKMRAKSRETRNFMWYVDVEYVMAAQDYSFQYARFCALVHRDYLWGTGLVDQSSYDPWILKKFFWGGGFHIIILILMWQWRHHW